MTTQLPLRIASSATRIAHLPKSIYPECAARLAYRSALRHKQQIRQYSSPPPPPQEPTKPIDLRSQFNSPNPYIKPVDPTSIPQNPSPPKRSLRPYIFAVVSLIIGLTAGQYVRLVLAPPPLPLPDTPEDKLMVEFLTSRAEKLPLVQSLSEDPKWISWDAYSNFNAAERAQRLTTGPLGGARGVGGFQRVFFNEETGECISVVWFGGALAGWPGVTHGGVIATIMDESLGRCAIYQFPSRTGVTANLELNYLRPTVTNEFYVVRAIPEKQGSTDKKTWVGGRLETLDGMVCVEAKALFVVPKKFKTRGMAGRF